MLDVGEKGETGEFGIAGSSARRKTELRQSRSLELLGNPRKTTTSFAKIAFPWPWG